MINMISKTEFIEANQLEKTTTPTEIKNNLRLLEKTQQLKEIILLEANIKPTGYNKFQKYHYFSLNDMVPVVIKYCNELGLATKFEFTNQCGKLKVFDLETGYYETWTTPLPEPQNPKSGERCKEIQAIQTYSRRALYLQWLEIVEVNTFDEAKPEKTVNPRLQKPQKQKPRQQQYQQQGKTITNKEETNEKLENNDKSLEEWGFTVQKELQNRQLRGTADEIRTVCKDLVGNSPIYWKLLKEFGVGGN